MAFNAVDTIYNAVKTVNAIKNVISTNAHQPDPTHVSKEQDIRIEDIFAKLQNTEHEDISTILQEITPKDISNILQNIWSTSDETQKCFDDIREDVKNLEHAPQIFLSLGDIQATFSNSLSRSRSHAKYLKDYYERLPKTLSAQLKGKRELIEGIRNQAQTAHNLHQEFEKLHRNIKDWSTVFRQARERTQNQLQGKLRETHSKIFHELGDFFKGGVIFGSVAAAFCFGASGAVAAGGAAGVVGATGVVGAAGAIGAAGVVGAAILPAIPILPLVIGAWQAGSGGLLIGMMGKKFFDIYRDVSEAKTALAKLLNEKKGTDLEESLASSVAVLSTIWLLIASRLDMLDSQITDFILSDDIQSVDEMCKELKEISTEYYRKVAGTKFATSLNFQLPNRRT